MTKWTEKELAELEDPDAWDWDSAEEHAPVENPGARVAVRFSAAELGLVEQAAEQAGLKLTEYIRTATLARAKARTMPRSHQAKRASG